MIRGHGRGIGLCAALAALLMVVSAGTALGQSPSFTPPKGTVGVTAAVQPAVELEIGRSESGLPGAPAQFNEARVRSNSSFSLIASSTTNGRIAMTLASHDTGSPLYVVPLRGYEDLLPAAASLEALYNHYRFTATQP